MTSRTITKVLVTHEDLALGQGTTTQTRQGANQTVTQIDLPWVVTSLVDVQRLNTTKYKHCILDDGTNVLLYRYDSTSAETVENYFYIKPNEGSGQWVLTQDLTRQRDITYADYAAFRTGLNSGKLRENDIVHVLSPAGPSFLVKTGAVSITDNGGTKIKHASADLWGQRVFSGGLEASWFGTYEDGSTDDVTYLQAAIDAANGGEGNGEVYINPVSYKLDARLVPKDNVTVIQRTRKKATFDFTGVLGTSSGESRCISSTSAVTNFSIEGIKFKADITYFVNNGFDTYVFRLDGSTNCHVINCEVEGGENGIIFRNGCSDCSVSDIVSIDCGYHSVGSWGTSSSPNVRMDFNKIRSYSTGTTEVTTAITGIYIEETYDSDVTKITAYNCNTGLRVENSADNRISHVTCYENWANGITIYNYSMRNDFSNIVVFDNNRTNHDAIDTAGARGNDNIHCSGINMELAFNNTLTNVIACQTPAAEVPFNSGSDEPWLGSKLQGTTSGATGRVRRINVTSGSWAGGDAAGTMYLVETSGTFNSSEVIQNVTTRVPYNSGGTEKPYFGQVLVGGTSGAQGTVLWASQQNTTGDWSVGNSEGYLYLTDVTGTFNAAEAINNNTTGTNDIATTNGAADAVDTDIATSNGTFVAATGSNKGFQKYGIGINVRNLVGTSTGDTKNTLTNIQAFNNDVENYHDRGYYNQITNLNEEYNVFFRNVY